jgi:hypothetical protein
MGRRSLATQAEERLDNARAWEARTRYGTNITQSIKNIGELVEPILWLGVFLYFTFTARTRLSSHTLKAWLDAGKGDPMLWLSDRTGYMVGPAVSIFMPAIMAHSLISIAHNTGINNLLGSFPQGHYVFDDRAGHSIIQAASEHTAQDGWWEAEWRRDTIWLSGMDKGKPGIVVFWFDGFRLTWPQCLMFGAVCTLLAKGGAGLAKGMIKI